LFICQFTIRKGQSEGKQFDFRFFDIIGESVTGTLGIDADFGSQVLFGHVVESIKNPVFYFTDDIFNRNAGALVTKVGTPLVSCPGRVKRAVVGEDFKGDHLQLVEDIDQDVKDFIIAEGAYPAFKIGESGLTGDIVWANACELTI